MKRILEWIKTHKLSTVLLAIIIAPFALTFFSGFFGSDSLSLPSGYKSSYSDSGGSYAPNAIEAPKMQMNTYSRSSESVSSTGRVVQQTASLSLLVTDVRKMTESAIDQAKALGGFMVSSNFSDPGEAPSAWISVRVPAVSLQAYMNQMRAQSIRVVSDSIQGNDITDQYKDVQARLNTLLATKAKLEAIYAKAILVQDILDVQNQIINNQDQIDQINGQKQYMEESSRLALVTINYSTDELSLPYAADSSWRPEVVFKVSVRSLVGTLRGLADMLIWIVVYAVVWIPIIIIIILIRHYKKKKSPVKLRKLNNIL